MSRYINPTLFDSERPAPGTFRSRCRKPLWVTAERLFEVNPDTTQSRWDKKLGCNVFLIQCDFSTDDRAVHLEHMKAVHGEKLTTGYGERTEAKEIHRMWRGPKLTDEGTTFEPEGVDLGAGVAWDGRTGQVWSKAPYPKSIWVVPDEPRHQEHPEKDMVRVERADCLSLGRRSGDLYEHETVWSSWTAQEVAA